ncbi:MAG: PSD1 and planctomycete cytochrome C domain-containing protein [Fuerstiella sp.]
MSALLPTVAVAAEPVDFNRDVRPILSDACFACHGPDSGQRQADLRLDQREGLFRSLDGVTVVDPKSVENSELLSRVLSDDPDIMMPPPDAGRTLSEAEKSILRRWIEEGAGWKGHWAYLPPQPPAVPDVAVSDTANQIDRFLQRSLNARNLPAAEQADPATLVRRLSLDLTGLPPSPARVRQFSSDPSPEQWELLISELLASHEYAERMTAFWLDQVRYADTNGIHGDNHRDVWMYRDWVIDAFHRNMPFDQFTVEQLAGDLLPDATDEQKIASGYNRLLMTTREGGAQAKEYLAKYSADRVRNASTVWLGATMGCCECHDHKFDPYSIRDFYQFAAFFADVKDVPVGVQPEVKMPSRAQKEQQKTLDARRASLQQTLDTQTAELDSALQQWAAELQTKLAKTPRVWNPVDVIDMKSSGGQTLTRLDDSSILAGGEHPKHDTYTVVLQPAAGMLSGLRLETLRHDSFVKKSLARGNGNFVLSGISLTQVRGADGAEHALDVRDALASYEQKDWPVSNVLDGKTQTGWAVDGHQSADRDPVAVFRLAEPIQLADGDRLIVTLQHKAVDFHNIGRFRISVARVSEPGLQDNTLGIPARLVDTVKAWPDVDDGGRTELAKHFRAVTPLLDETRTQLAQTEKAIQDLQKQIPETLITLTQAPREIRVLARGNWMDDSGDVVDPSVPHFLPPLSANGRASRLDLAEWFVDDNNPLVARVFVNRLWKLFFGKGIVKSTDDFGSQGSWPTHPDLLDWLALEFRNSGWDVQHVIRLIVLSDAYRRSSVATPEMKEADPFNDWLARQSRFRLDAEFIRDGALAVSGLLVDRVGGPSVKPYQPAGYWAHLNFPKRAWQADQGENQHRRGLYTYWCRTFLHPAMRSFDAPTREECTVERPRSNNSLQALVLLNDPSYVEAARGLATRALEEGGGTTNDRIRFIFDLCLARPPRAEEVEVLTDLLDEQLKQFVEAPAEVDKFLQVGQVTPKESLDKPTLAAWTAVARVVLNLHETITRS